MIHKILFIILVYGVGIFIGGSIMVSTVTFKLGEAVQESLDACESKLPRNENCVFTTVPREKSNASEANSIK